MTEESAVKKKRAPGYGGYGGYTGSDGPGAGAEISWGELLYGLRKKQWFIYLGVLLGALGGFLYLKQSAVIYQAQAVMMTEVHKKVVNIEEIQTADLNVQQDLNTFIQIISSRTVLARAAHSLKESPETKALTEISEDRLLSELLKTVTVTVRLNTRFIVVAAEHPDPETARAIADKVAQEAVNFTVEQGSSVTKGANEFLMAEVSRQREKLKTSEQALQQFKEDNKEFFPGGSQFAVAEQYQSLSKSLQGVTEERALLEFDAARAKQMGNDTKELVKLPTVVKDPAVISTTGQLSEKQVELEQISRRYKQKHPKYIACSQEIARLEQQLNEKILEAAKNIDSALDQATRRQTDYAAEVKSKEELAFQVNKKLIQVNVLQRDIDTNKVLNDTVLSRLKETDLTKGLRQTPLAIYESAVAPRLPIRPNPPRIFGISLSVGLIAGLALAFGLNMMDNSIKTVNEAEALTGQSVLCVLPNRILAAPKNGKAPKENESPKLGLDAADTPHGQIAEAFRTLRASLSLLGPSDSHRKYLFTSAFPSEGKSFCCANFAITLAGQGLKTLLVDADLRKPTVANLFYKQKKAPGLAEYLAQQAPLAETVHPTSVANLYTVPAGNRSPKPAELLAGPMFKAFLEEALKHFDRVVVDTAPVIAVSDTLLLAPHVDSVCLVIWGSKTPRTAVTRATKMLISARAPLSGIILNRLPIRKGSYYNYYYYYTGYYGSEGVYGAPKEGAA